MGWRLTPEERRIIERTRRDGEELYAGETPEKRKSLVWRSVLVWVATLVAFALLATLIVFIGTLFR
jgi:hypothetical protein